MKYKKVFILLLISIFLFPLINAAPPQTSTNTEIGYEIQYPKYEYAKQGSNFTLHTHLFNKSTGMPLMDYENIGCVLHLYFPNGSHSMKAEMDFDEVEWEISISEGNFSNIGPHAYIIYCNSTEFGGFASGVFETTPTGQPPLGAGEGLVFLGSILLLIIISLFFCYLGIRTKQGMLQVSMISFSVLILVFALGFILQAYQSLMAGYPSIVSNFSTAYTLFIILVGIGIFSLIVYLIYLTFNLWWKSRGLQDSFKDLD